MWDLLPGQRCCHENQHLLIRRLPDRAPQAAERERLQVVKGQGPAELVTAASKTMVLVAATNNRWAVRSLTSSLPTGAQALAPCSGAIRSPVQWHETDPHVECHAKRVRRRGEQPS